jgi:hypothetical protein
MAGFLYDKEVTPWEDPGVAPEAGQRIWEAGEEPPAAWWNFFWDAVHKCFGNIKLWINGHKDADTGVHGVGTGHIETVEGAQAKVNSGISAHLAAPDPHPVYATDNDLTSHNQANTGVHGVGTGHIETSEGAQVKVDSAVNTHLAAANPHPQYVLESELGGKIPNDAVDDNKIGNRTANPTQVPSGSIGKLTQWLSWFCNRLVAVTGKINWYDTPRTTLENAVKLNGDAMTGTLTINKAIGTTGSYTNSHLLLQASDSNDVAFGFNRPGQTACALLHKANAAGLQLVDASGVLTEFRAGKVFNAVYNDYAEYFLKDEQLEPGDVIAKSLDGKGYVKTKTANEKLVVGVYSDDYAQCIGGDSDKSLEEQERKYAPVGLAGKVRVKVTGEIKPGDLLISSHLPGVAMACKDYTPGTVIGKALQYHNGDLTNRIEMLVINM